MAARPYFLRTPRLGFGVWSPEDLPLALALWGDILVTRYIGGPFSAEAVRQRLDAEIGLMARDGVQYWPIFLLDGDEHAGCAGLRPYRREAGIHELGVHLRPACWHRGLGVEAGRAVIGFAFSTLHAAAIFAGHHPSNTASERMLKALGFRFTHRELYPPTGLHHPSYLLERPGAAPCVGSGQRREEG
jgi:RimJ/RimL family protein N-acetyltransferase